MQAYVRVLALAAGDAVCMFAVWAFNVWIYWAVGIASYPEGPSAYLDFWPAIPAFIALNAAFRLYNGNPLHPAAPVPPVEELRRLVASAALTHVGVIAYIALAQQSIVGVSRFVIVMSGVLVALVAQPVRDCSRQIMHSLRVGRIPVLFAGSGDAADRLVGFLASDSYTGFHIVRRFGADELDEVAPAAGRLGARTLVACMDIRMLQCRMDEFAKHFTHVEYVVPSKTFPVLGAKAVSFGGTGGLEMVNRRLMKLPRIEKFALDKFLAFLAFAVSIPVFVAIPILIKLTSKGPVFYRQKRIGFNGRPFMVWKFRSMHADADARLDRILSENPAARSEWESSFKLKDDPRVTPFGRLLRKTSLDELPQLFNVFSGEMALIGPRPIIDDEVRYYGDAYKTFSSVKPGITGLWQVSGRSDTDYAQRVALDTYYVLNWSPWLDLWILVRTAFAVLLMRGAR